MTITKSWYAKPLYLVVALVLALGLALPAVTTANADVSTPQVTLGSYDISDNTTYTVKFDSIWPLNSGTDTITVTFPAGTTVPAQATWRVAAPGDITVNDGVGGATNVVPGTITVPAGTNKVTFDVPVGECAVASHVTVDFAAAAGINNPSTPGDYTLTVATSQETVAVTSTAYTITEPAVPGVVKVYNADNILVAQTTNLEAAIETEVTGNDFTVEVAPGTYSVNAAGGTVVPAVTGLTIKATGAAADTKVTVPVTVTGQATIEGMTFEGGVTVNNAIAAPDDTVTLKGCVFSKTETGAAGTGLLTLTAGTVTVDGCTADTVKTSTTDPTVGIGVAAVTKATITGCTFTTDANDTAAVGLADDATVKDSVFSGAGAVGVGDVTGGLTVTISGNTFDGLDQAIVSTMSELDYTIKGNTIKNCTSTTLDAIALANATKAEIFNNVFTDNKAGVLDVTLGGANVKMLFNDLSGNAGKVTNAAGVLDASHNNWDIAPTADTATVTYLPVMAGTSSDADAVTGVAALVSEDTAGVDVTTNQTTGAIIAAAKYAANPGSDLSYPALAGGFYDVYLGAATDATTVTIKLYNSAVTANTLVYGWSDLAGEWVDCTKGVNTFGGYVYTTLTVTSEPAIADLSGMPFALVEKPAPAPAGPGLVALSTPKDGVTGTAINTIPFTWNSVAGADSYIWQLSSDAAQTVWVDRQALTSTAYTYSVMDLEYETPYYWKVTAGEGLALSKGAIVGTILAESEVQTFVTGEEPAATIVYTSPYTGDTFTDETAFLAHMNYYDAQQQAQTQPAPSWVWVLIGIGAVLVIVTLVLIFRSRRV